LPDKVLVFPFLSASTTEDPAQSRAAIRLLCSLEHNATVTIGSPAPSSPGDRPSDDLFMELEQFRIHGHTKVIFLTDMPEAHWQNLLLELIDAHPNLEISRVIPEQIEAGIGYTLW